MHMHKTRWAFALLVAAACSSALAATPTLDEAHHAYYHGQFARSLRMYQQLAAGGNAEAAERAGFMLFHGGGYYGRQVRRDPGRASALLLQAAKAGRPGAGFMLNMTERTD
jgi:TPR repeat protein